MDAEEVIRNNAVAAPARRRGFRLGAARTSFIQVSLIKSYAEAMNGMFRYDC